MNPEGLFVGILILSWSFWMGAKIVTRKEQRMANETQQEAKVELMSEAQFNELIGTNCVKMGDTLVYGAQLLSPKFADIVNEVLTRGGWGVEVLLFSVNQPSNLYGLFSFSRKTAVINLGQHWDSAVKLVKNKEHYLSIRAHVWHNMLLSLFHELLHGQCFLDEEAALMMTEDEREEMAETESRIELEELAINFDIEPPPMAEEPFFGTRYMQFFIDAISNGTDTWAVRQNEMHDEKYLYLDEGNDVLVESFRDYLRAAFDVNSKDKEWDEIIPRTITKFQVPLLAAPITPATETVIVVSETGEATVTATATVEAPYAPLEDETVGDVEPDDLSLKVGWEDEALRHLLGEDGVAHGMEPSMHVSYGAGAPMATAPLPASQVAPTITPAVVAGAFCSKCGQPTGAGAMFCTSCGNPTTATAMPATVLPAPHPGVSHQTLPAMGYPVTHGQPWQQSYNHGQNTHVQNTRIEVLDTNLPPHALTGEQMSAIIREVYMRLYYFCFDKCGWQMPLPPAVLQDTTGTLCADGFHRDVRQAVQGGFSVADIPGVNQLIYQYRSTHASTGQLSKIPADGMIRGWIATGVDAGTTRPKNIPCFNLYLNVKTGEAIKRVFIPQNPYKIKNGRYTDTAMKAQNGDRLAYIFNGDDRIPQNDPRKYVGDIKNGQLTIKTG
jgi:hypothetical protein